MRKRFWNWKIYIGSVALLLLFVAGFSISEKSWNGDVFIYLDTTSSNINTRNIASIGKQMDTSRSLLKGGQLKQEGQKALTNSSRIENTKEVIQFYLGHFLVKTKGGRSILACQKYQTLDMVFISPGISSHGHVPKLVMKADCNFDSNNPLHIGPFTIPKKRILSSSPHTELFKSEGATLFFSHVSVQWPETWILSQVRFIQNNTHQDFTVSFSSKKEEDYFTLNLRESK
ncbi:MAG: hypothetical protein F4X95_02585 [Oligoflexia bacterium]|nr:hypothetical protein [Oligoflexia bacterium]